MGMVLMFKNLFNREKKVMERDERIKLGSLARDTITGFTGVVVAVTEWLNGCKRISVQPKEMKDGKPVDAITFDAEQLVFVEDANPVLKPKPKGGPSISPVGWPNQSR